MALIKPDVIGSIMQDVLACVVASLNGYDVPVARTLLAPGNEVAWDECCDGQLAIRLIETYPTMGKNSPFPNKDFSASNCAGLMASRLGISLIRCVPVVQDSGASPSAADLTEATLRLTRDMSIVLEAIKCCIMDDEPDTKIKNVERVAIDGYTSLGPQGGCAGGEWQIIIGHGACAC